MTDKAKKDLGEEKEESRLKRRRALFTCDADDNTAENEQLCCAVSSKAIFSIFIMFYLDQWINLLCLLWF